MILEQDLSEIGRIIKTHGINGELAATVDSDIDLSELRCIVLEIDGIYVPFFLNGVRSRGSEAVLVSIDGVDDEKSAALLCGHDIYCLRSDLGDSETDDDEGFYVSDLIGYHIFDSAGKEIGTVEDYDDSTANLLLHVKDKAGRTVFVPLADELVVEFDTENKKLTLDLPEGVLDL